MTKFEKQIRNYMDAAFPILYIHTAEEAKAKSAILQAASDIPRIEILSWDGTDRSRDLKSGEAYPTSKYPLTSLLDNCMGSFVQQCHIFVLENIETFMEDSSVTARLKKLAEHIHSGEIDASILIISPVLKIPPELEKYITVMEMDYLDESEIEDIIQRFIDEEGIWISETLKHEFATAFKGLSEFEIEHILQLAYSSDGQLRKSHISLIFEQKQQLIKKAGILEMVPLRESLSDIGGLECLKEWLTRKERVISQMDKARKFGVDMPKGVLIAGVPGCGKSLSAKAAAKLFNIPLLRLDMGRLLGKYLGESEGNMRKAIRLAEALSPCVLWIDELEKAFTGTGGEGSGSEVATRLLGSFLTWLQEKESAAFVVATANDITKLPPELLRKGRFDEIFSVDLPNLEERRKIFDIHIGKRRSADLPGIDLDQLAKDAEGYSGADIEGVVRESVEMAFTDGKDSLTTEDIRHAMAGTQSLSEIMKDSIKKMQVEYQNRKLKKASK